ncbi:hypothetical protein FACS1894199_19060 [Bacteroidia bacterium]|nr:hypothetical protein FACS1894199_19060 [Bacteroidia bacterium]
MKRTVFFLSAMALGLLVSASVSAQAKKAAAPAPAPKAITSLTGKIPSATLSVKLRAGETEVATGSLSNGSFTLALPATLKPGPDTFLDPITSWAKGEEVKISAPTAKFWRYMAPLQVYLGETLLGSASYTDSGEEMETSLYLVYVDKDVTVKGSVEGCAYDLTLKKGWNKAYQKGSALNTTTEPKGLKWVFTVNN